MTTYAKATNVRVPHLTEGREYRVGFEHEGRFYMTADDGGALLCRWNDCPHLDGGSWQRIERPANNNDLLDRIEKAYHELGDILRAEGRLS